MSFWQTSDNAKLDTTGKFEVSGGEPIPENTTLKVMATSAQWDEYQDSRFISIEWTVIEGDYKNRKVFQKVRVMEPSPAKRDRAIRMLAAIDANAGGGLMALGREPSDMDLQQHLMNKIMFIKVQVWEIEGKTGNWVSAVAGAGVQQPAAPAQPAQAAPAADPFDESIPF